MRMHPLLRSAPIALIAAFPLAAQVPSDLAANEGIDLQAPPGWPPFEQVRRDDASPRLRMYVTRRDDGVVMISVANPPEAADQDLGRRRALLEALAAQVGRDPTELIRTWEDSTHLVSDVRFTHRGGQRGVRRTYVSRAGPVWWFSILVGDGPRAPHPADDPAVQAWLGQVRLRADEPRPPAAVTFDEAGVRVLLPPGFPAPAQFFENPANGVRIFRSQAGSRGVRVFVAHNQDEDEGAGWSAALRIGYMEEAFRPLFEQLGSPELGPLTTAGGMSYRDFRLGEGEGRGRVYTTRTGPHRVAMVIYVDDRGIRPGDEDVISAMLQSVRVR